MINKNEVGLNVGRNGNSLMIWIKYVVTGIHLHPHVLLVLPDEDAGKVFLMSIWWGWAHMVYVNIRIMTSIMLSLAV